MTEIWRKVLRDKWGINAKLNRLDGEFDLNFLANAHDGQRYVIKVMREGCDPSFIDMQTKALNLISQSGDNLPVPKVIPPLSSGDFELVTNGTEQRIVWVLDMLPGNTFARHAAKNVTLINDIGQKIALMDGVLSDYTHPDLSREFKWKLMQADWIKDHLEIIKNPDQKAILSQIVSDFHTIKPILDSLDHVAIHNDVNDYNLLVSENSDEISGIIDFGDMCLAPRICELAIAAAYIVLDHPNPWSALDGLVSGYNSHQPLSSTELSLIWPLLRMRLAVSVVNSTLMALDNPNDPYITISQAPAWRFLERRQMHSDLVLARLRMAVGQPVVDTAPAVMTFLREHRGSFAQVIKADLKNAPLGSLSVEKSITPINPFELKRSEAAHIGDDIDGEFWLGYYNEPRLIYTDKAFRNGKYMASDRRTLHLGVDIFGPTGTQIHTPLDATVYAIENRTGNLDYGGVVILEHTTPTSEVFYTLYGHLNPAVCDALTVGQKLPSGSQFAVLGDETQNGGWAPHLHFQLALSVDGLGDDWPGVADPDQLELWNAICPNPAPLLNLEDEKVGYVVADKAAVLKGRQEHFGENLALSYRDPLMLVRGWKHHLFDQWGRPYLDAYNNVPHVGHAHPRIRAIAADQLARMNSNTRYLHPAQTELAEKLLSKVPPELSVCYFVNSGSEANELALRLARAKTGGKNMITPDHGYFGNTTGAIDISAYKFNAKGGVGQPDWVELVDNPDDYRGQYKRDDPKCAQKYAALVDTAIEKVQAKGGKLAGFVTETFPSVGGQIIPPKGYLGAVYKKIRAAGGVCIADEVQTGFGRLGDYYFGIHHQDVVPDIMVMGKPFGNGHPLGAVVTTAEIAESFAKGPEFFSTFGCSTLSARIGKEVLDIVDDESLMENARLMGSRLLAGLNQLKIKHNTIGDVRGFGLFIGLELVKNQETLEPATLLTSQIINAMRDRRILIGAEGFHNNILKIRPPLTIQSDDIDMIVENLDIILTQLGVAHEV